MTNTVELSELEQELLKRSRRTFEFEFKDYAGGTKNTLSKVRVRVATVDEQEKALIAAHEYIQKKTSENASAAALDTDLVNNIKAAFILHKVALHPVHDRPIFSGPEAMMKLMSTDELAKLFEYYQAVLKEFSPFDIEVTEEKIEAVAAACAASWESDAPNIILSQFTAAQKSELIIRISMLLDKTRKEHSKVKDEGHAN